MAELVAKMPNNGTDDHNDGNYDGSNSADTPNPNHNTALVKAIIMATMTAVIYSMMMAEMMAVIWQYYGDNMAQMTSCTSKATLSVTTRSSL